MPRGRPVTPEKRALVLDLHATGKGRNEIAVELDMAAASVTKIVGDAGLSFDRSMTKAATEAHQIDLAAQRAVLARRLLAKTSDFLDALDKPFLVFNFGGKDNTYEEHQLPGPPTGDIKNLMTSAGIAIQRSIELEKVDSDRGQAAAVTLLDSLSEAFGMAADALDQRDDAQDHS